MSRYAIDEIKNLLLKETNKTLFMIQEGKEIKNAENLIIDISIRDIRKLSVLSNRYTADYLKNDRIVIEDVEIINEYTDSCIKSIFNCLRMW